MTNFSPSSTSNVQPIFLEKIQYPQDDFESYSLEADKVTALLKEHRLPEIRIDLPEDNRPRIAVILAQEKHPLREKADYAIHPDYVNALLQAGGYPIFVSYEKLSEQLDNIQPKGILLIGGCFNVPKEWYNKTPLSDIDQRGKAYLELCDYAKEHHLPTLGICAGHQVLAGIFHGKLKQNINQGRSEKDSHKQGGYVLAHEVNLVPGSKLYNIVQKSCLRVNSAHNEAVCDENTDCFLVSARAPDGIIEAIEPKAPWHDFVLGIQWHPERLVKLGDEDNLKIFKAFIGATKND